MKIHDSADEELRAAVAYYEACEKGLGDEFFAEVLRGFEQIGQQPQTWPATYQDYRRYLIHRFPYALVYRYSAEETLILAIAHTHRRPGYWRERVRQTDDQLTPGV